MCTQNHLERQPKLNICVKDAFRLAETESRNEMVEEGIESECAQHLDLTQNPMLNMSNTMT